MTHLGSRDELGEPLDAGISTERGRWKKRVICVPRHSKSAHRLMQNTWAGVLSLSSGCGAVMEEGGGLRQSAHAI